VRRFSLCIDEEACWGCRTCEVVCKQEKDTPAGVRLTLYLQGQGMPPVRGAGLLGGLPHRGLLGPGHGHSNDRLGTLHGVAEPAWRPAPTGRWPWTLIRVRFSNATCAGRGSTRGFFPPAPTTFAPPTASIWISLPPNEQRESSRIHFMLEIPALTNYLSGCGTVYLKALPRFPAQRGYCNALHDHPRYQDLLRNPRRG